MTYVNRKWTFFILELYFCPNFWTNHFYNKKETINNRNTILVLPIYFKMKKISLLVDVSSSKTPLLNLPNITLYVTLTYVSRNCEH